MDHSDRNEVVESPAPHRQSEGIGCKQLITAVLLVRLTKQSYTPVSSHHPQFLIHPHVLAVPAAHIQNQTPILETIQELFNFGPSLISGVAEVRGDAVIHIINVFLLDVGGLCGLRMMRGQELFLLVSVLELILVYANIGFHWGLQSR